MNNDKWYFITVIVAIIVYGTYKTVELTFDKLEVLQKNGQIIISK